MAKCIPIYGSFFFSFCRWMDGVSLASQYAKKSVVKWYFVFLLLSFNGNFLLYRRASPLWIFKKKLIAREYVFGRRYIICGFKCGVHTLQQYVSVLYHLCIVWWWWHMKRFSVPLSLNYSTAAPPPYSHPSPIFKRKFVKFTVKVVKREWKIGVRVCLCVTVYDHHLAIPSVGCWFWSVHLPPWFFPSSIWFYCCGVYVGWHEESWELTREIASLRTFLYFLP